MQRLIRTKNKNAPETILPRNLETIINEAVPTEVSINIAITKIKIKTVKKMNKL